MSSSNEQQNNSAPVPVANPSTPRLADLAHYADPGNLFGRTLRTIVLLVGSCVLFVGALSTAAVVITSKAVGSASPDTSAVRDTSSATQKKPLSI